MEHDDTIELIHAMFAATGSGGMQAPGVVCPWCPPARASSVSNVHIESVKHYSGNDAYDAGHHYNIGVRGDVVVLRFWCEEGGHRWALVLGGHKGAIKLMVIPEEGIDHGAD